MSAFVHHTTGDATAPADQRPCAIIHICNDIGAWGSGFVLAVSERWKAPEQAYRVWARRNPGRTLPLGQNLPVQVEDGLYVVNMIAQKGVSRTVRAVSYDALDECLADLYGRIVPSCDIKSVHAPLIGTGLGGGDWDVIEALLWAHATVPTVIYHLPGTGHRVDL